MQLNNPIDSFLEQKNYIIIDGALASELQRRGCDLNDSLWSAKILIEQPDLIAQIHYDYFKAGADCAITSSYQATPLGFAKKGLSLHESIKLIKQSVQLAQIARQRYLQEIQINKPLFIAGSVGPYGAYLANGSEYTGNYQLSETEFIDFHYDRIKVLIDERVDLLACETLPCFTEIKALTQLIKQFPQMPCWFSFTLKDSLHLSDGTPLKLVTDYLNNIDQVVSIGVNCIALEHVTNALKTLKTLTTKPLIVYPNSGEQYDPETKLWYTKQHNQCVFANQLPIWKNLGAKLIGGCCQTTPDDISEIAKILKKHKVNKRKYNAKSTVAVGIIAILGIAYIGTSWYTGNIIENNINQKVTEFSQQINNYQDKANITISYSDYQKGIFSTKLHLMITASDKQEVRSSEAPTTIFNDDITIHHGPFPMAALSNGTFSPQMAWIEYEMSEKVSPTWWKLAGNQPFITGHIGISYQEYLSLNIVNKAINIAGSTETDCQNLSIYDSEDLKDDNEGKDCILDISAGNFSFESNKNFTHLSVNANLDKFSYEQKEWEAFSLNKFNFSAQTNHEKTGIRYQFNLGELNTDIPGYHSMSRLTVDNMTSQGNITYAKNIKLQIAADNIIFIPDIFEFPSLNINQFTFNQNSLFNSSPNRIDGELNIKIGSFLVGKQNLGNGEFDFDFQDVDNQFLSERLGLTNNQDNKVKENDQVNMKISLNKFNWQNSVGDININALYNFSGTRESIRNIGIDNVDVVKINIDMPLNVLIQLRAQLENPLSDTVTAEELNQVKKSIPMISEFVKNSPFLSFKKGDVEGIYSEIDYAKERDKISINGQEISKDKFFNEHPITR